MLAPSRYTSRTEEHIPEYNEQVSVLLIRIFAGESNQRGDKSELLPATGKVTGR